MTFARHLFCWNFTIRTSVNSLLGSCKGKTKGKTHRKQVWRKPVTIRVMFIGTQVDTISCKGADSVCCPLLAFFLCFFIMREAGISRLGAAQCAAAPRPAPLRCPPCQCRGTRCGCSGGSCGSISPSARLPRSSGWTAATIYLLFGL